MVKFILNAVKLLVFQEFFYFPEGRFTSDHLLENKQKSSSNLNFHKKIRSESENLGKMTYKDKSFMYIFYVLFSFTLNSHLLAIFCSSLKS